MNNKKAQMEISFGMIVSVILIIVFVAFAFYAISKFLGMQRSVQIGKFTDDLQFDIDKIWKTSQGSQEVSYILPGRIVKACFIDYSSPAKGTDSLLYEELKLGFYGSENLIFYPIGSAEGLDSKIISHINLEKITETKNPFCIANEGKIKMTLSMDFGESLVCVSDEKGNNCPKTPASFTPEAETSKTICKNAEDSNLCDALDFTYESGYKSKCCSEHELCC